MIGDKILKYKKISFGISIFFVAISLCLVAFKGISKSVEFVGGTLIEVKSSNPVNLDVFNEKLSAQIKNIDKNLIFFVKLCIKLSILFKNWKFIHN